MFNGRLALWTLPLLLLGPGAEAAAQPQGTLVVANRQGGSVSLFDLATGFEVGRLPVGPEAPHEVAVSPDGRWIAAGAYGTGRSHGRHVVIMDLVNVREVGRIDLGEKSRPHSLAFLPDNRRVVVTMEEADRLALVDIETLEVLRTYETGGREGHMVRLSPDGRRAYVASRLGKGTLSVIFLEEERDPVVIVTGGGAEGIAVSPDGGEVWIANRTEGTISIVDAARLEVVATLPSHPFAGRVDMSGDGYVAVPNGGGAQQVVQHLQIIDLQSRKVVADVPLRDGQPASGGFGVLARGSSVYVAGRGDRDLRVFDLTRPTSAPTLLADHNDAPDGMAWSPLRVAAFDR